MGGRSTCFHGLLLLLLLVVSFSQQTAAASARNTRLLARLLQPSGPVCEPWSVPETERCAYIQDHAAICYPEGGFQAYLAIHFCWFPPYWRWVSLLLLVAAAALALAVLLTVSERFFCPALELISDYLKLPPVVAGATLLSFGNGAPDTFTQVAAVGQEGGAAVGMALSEPLGGGMFASNVVFGLVVLIASKQQAVIPRASFLKDVAFYLLSLVVIAYMLGDGKVTAVEAGALLGLYVVYVCVTFYTSRADEPLHADLALHEFPPEDGGIDAPDSSSEDFNFESSDIEHQHPEYIDATTSIRDFDLEAPYAEPVHTDITASPAHLAAAAPDGAGSLSGPSASSSGSDPTAAGQAAAGSSSSPASSRTLQALLSWRHRSSNPGLHEPLLLSIAESPARPLRGHLASDSATSVSCEANSGGDTVDGHRGRHRSTCRSSTEDAGREDLLASPKVQLNARELSLADMLRDGAAQSEPSQQQQQQGTQTDSASESEESPPVWQQQLTGSSSNGSAAPLVLSSSGGSRAAGLPAPVFARLGGADLQGVPPTHSSSSSRRGFAAHGSRTFTEGTRLRGNSLSPVAPSDRTTADASSSSLPGWSPRAASDSGVPPAALTGYLLLGGRPVSPRLLGAVPYSLTLPRSQPTTPRVRRASDLGPGAAVPGSPLQQLHEQHFAEQQELLEQQAAEHDALLAAHEDQQEVLKAGGMSLKHRLQYPFVQMLSCTMPRVGTGSGHRYGRWRACLLPLTVPLLWFAADPGLVVGIGWLGLVFGCSCAAVGSGIIWATYPASDVPRKALKGVFAVLAFVQAVVWLNLSASGLVQICVVVGTIFGLQPALLGATVLAWGNSVPDVINNTAMARDGFPSMAVAACFASPLFTLLMGMGGALTYGTILHNGPLPVPVDGPLMVMAGFSIVSMVQHLLVVPWVARYRMQPSLAVLTFLFYACFNVVYVLATVGVIQIRPLQPGPG